MRYHWKDIENAIPTVVHSPHLVKNCKSYGSLKFQPSRELKLRTAITFAILHQITRMNYRWKHIFNTFPTVIHSPHLVKNYKGYGSSKFQPSRELKLRTAITLAILHQIRRMNYRWKRIFNTFLMISHSPHLV
jgi:hypothetical protein